MTVILLTSAEKPLLAFARQRLSAFSGRVFLTIPVQQGMSVANVLTELGLTAETETALFEGMPGMHIVPCGDTVVYAVLSEGERPDYSSVIAVYDEIWVETPAKAAPLRRFFTEKTKLYSAENSDDAPIWLRREKGWYCLRKGTNYIRSTYVNVRRDAIVVGAGLAGAMTAWELSRRGCRVTVIDAGCVPGSAASALFAGLIHPHWQAADSPLFRLTRAGYEAMIPLLERFPDCFIPCGVVDAASSEEEYEKWRAAYGKGVPFVMPEAFATLLSRDEARQYSGMPLTRGGWLFPRAGLVHAGRLCRRLIEASGVRMLTGCEVRLRRSNEGWEAVSSSGSVLASASQAAVCAGLATPDVIGIPRTWTGMSGLYGHISLLRDIDLPMLRTALTGDGYMASTPEGFCAVGATYESGEARVLSESEAHEHNLATFDKLTGRRPVVTARGFYEGVRAVAADRMPLAGRAFTAETMSAFHYRGRPEVSAVPRADGLWICTGLGSRGITWGLACARLTAAGICGEPLPLQASLVRQLDPARFLPKLFGTKH